MLATSPAHAAASCRVAYDIGSSVIRAGASDSGMTPRAGVDYLASLQENGSLDAAVEPTVAALTEPFRTGMFETACVRVGSGFCAWRLALQQDVGKQIPVLTKISAAAGVAVIVVPQNVEGAYGYLGARGLLGKRTPRQGMLSRSDLGLARDGLGAYGSDQTSCHGRDPAGKLMR